MGTRRNALRGAVQHPYLWNGNRQDKQFFFERCAELNKQKLITQGKGRYAQYIMQPKDTLRVADRIENAVLRYF